ncbi:Succinyl-CoA:(R)-benzylsuccinate CoA-transferase subunit BbsF [bioreactor metagenome]|uniref:Succinyl-CoA:(R)-benzylsuccinate CoA-transferase subunit BbsF n=1 Tax=bioreactor metagenome TaxID=1076179 RepID=A0A645AKW0_9ZZZZ
MRNDDEWQRLLTVLNVRCDEPQLRAAEGRIRNAQRVDELVSQWLARHDADAICERLQQAGVSAHVSWNMQDIADDAHLRARGVVTQVSADDLPPRPAVGAPARFSRTDDVGIHRLTPALGQDEDYVFGELLGLSGAQREALEAREVIL